MQVSVSANGRRTRKGRNVSLGPEHETALRWLAGQDGHDVPSRIVQRLIEREMWERFGPNWRDRLSERVAHDERAA